MMGFLKSPDTALHTIEILTPFPHPFQNANMAQLPPAPDMHPITDAHFVHPEKRVLSNGVPLYAIDGAADDILKLEAVFPAGRRYETAPGVSAAAAKLMTEGAPGLNGSAIAETVERYGASLKVRGGFDYTTLQLQGLNRFLDRLLPVVHGIVYEASYPEKECANYVRNNRQKIKIREQKVDYLADNGMREALYGPQHPYGYKMTGELFSSLTRQSFLDHHRRTIAQSQPFLIAAGRITDQVLDFAEAAFGRAVRMPIAATPYGAAQPAATLNIHQFKLGSVQSALRFAKPIMAKSHEDYRPFFVLNTILGGYFGSRLMSNIREDKGYTYGIYSGMTHLDDASYFYISAEVGSHVCQPAITEVYAEMQRLRDIPVGDEELDLVRNYLLGTILGSIDGPFRTADTVRGILQGHLPMDYVQQLVDTIRTVTPVQLQALANRYLRQDDLLELVVGWPEEATVLGANGVEV